MSDLPPQRDKVELISLDADERGYALLINGLEDDYVFRIGDVDLYRLAQQATRLVDERRAEDTYYDRFIIEALARRDAA